MIGLAAPQLQCSCLPMPCLFSPLRLISNRIPGAHGSGLAGLMLMTWCGWCRAGLVEEYGSPDQMKGDAVLREGGPLPVLPRVHMTELPKFK